MSPNSTSTALLPAPSLRKFTLEEVELGLHLLALNGGNVLRTQRLLHAEGVIAPGRDLRLDADLRGPLPGDPA